MTFRYENYRWLLAVVRIAALVIAAVNVGAAVVAESMGEDGMNYLDQGDAWMRGDWAMAVNGTWSPLYSIILGLAARVVRPPVAWEFPLAHLVNFGVFVVTLVCFDYFWRQVTDRYYAAAPGESSEPDRLPPWLFLVIGYGLFIWSATSLIRLFAVTPDMLVAACVFLAGGLLLRITGPHAGRWTMVALGTVLGVGYLTKAVMFPLAIVALGVTGWMLVRTGRTLRALVPGAAAFMLVSSTLLVPLSLETGRFTFSEVGRTSYLRHVLRAPYPHYEAGSPHVVGEPLHPVTRSSTTPPVFRFAGAAQGTYPLAYDQGYWYAGLVPLFQPGLQLRAIALNLQRYFELFFRTQGVMIGAAIVFLLLVIGVRRSVVIESVGLLLLGLPAFALYSLVYVEGRYVAPFLVLLWASLLLSVRLPATGGHARWIRACGMTLIIGMAVNIAAFHLDGFNALARIAPVARAGPVSRTVRPSARPSVVANGLHAAGLQRGDSIGVIGEAIAATWARLGRLRIVADVAPDDVPLFWEGSPAQQGAVLEAFAKAGVRAVVAEGPASDTVPPGWARVGGTRWYLRFIDPDADSRAGPAPNR